MVRSCAHPVLVVDDDDGIRHALQQVFEDEGYEVSTASNGRDALDKIEQMGLAGPPCVIVLDLMMPVMDGREFLTHRTGDPSLRAVPVVVVSAFAGEPASRTCRGS